MNELTDFDIARLLSDSLKYVRLYRSHTVVVKYGGNAMISDELRHAVISDIILLHLVGVHVVVVHGGGPEISDMLKKIGKESHFVDGLRYTDRETMDVVQQVLCGKVNKPGVVLTEQKPESRHTTRPCLLYTSPSPRDTR